VLIISFEHLQKGSMEDENHKFCLAELEAFDEKRL